MGFSKIYLGNFYMFFAKIIWVFARNLKKSEKSELFQKIFWGKIWGDFWRNFGEFLDKILENIFEIFREILGDFWARFWGIFGQDFGEFLGKILGNILEIFREFLDNILENFRIFKKFLKNLKKCHFWTFLEKKVQKSAQKMTIFRAFLPYITHYFWNKKVRSGIWKKVVHIGG